MTKTGKKSDPELSREARLAAALRDNLKRRKTQARTRAGKNTPGDAAQSSKTGAGAIENSDKCSDQNTAKTAAKDE